MFFNILDESRLRLLKDLLNPPPVADAYLAGGTALALLLGHRESIDFDWFSPVMFATETITKRLSELGQVRISETQKGAFHGFVNDIQVTWLHYPNPLLGELIESPHIPGLKLASLIDIAVMKWAALSSRGSRKDFIDLYFIVQNGLELETLLPLLAPKYPGANINYYHMVKSLSFFDDTVDEPWPVMHKALEWAELKEFFQEQQKQLLDKYL